MRNHAIERHEIGYRAHDSGRTTNKKPKICWEIFDFYGKTIIFVIPDTFWECPLEEMRREIIMGHYYHIFANGDDAQNFIKSESDIIAAINRFAICAAKYPNVIILAFSIEESHPHGLIFGEHEKCVEFKRSYEALTFSYIINSRGSKDGVVFDLELKQIEDEEYLLNASAYILIQPTKDGKQILPHDYKWGTASMYFRPEGLPQIWCYDSGWKLCECRTIKSLSYKEKRKLCHSAVDVPDNWLVCNNIILPTNYVNIKMFEDIFKSFNRYRTFMAAGRNQLQKVADGMAAVRGVAMTDLEARQLSAAVSLSMFGKKDSRWLTVQQRLSLAKELRQKHHLCFRQVATMTRLPEIEVRKYIL